MNVIFRTPRNRILTAPLEFEGPRAFAVIYELGPKDVTAFVKRVELDARLLEKIDPKQGADYLYTGQIDAPHPDV